MAAASTGRSRTGLADDRISNPDVSRGTGGDTLAYDVAELLDHISTVYGADYAAGVAGATGVGGSITVVEMGTPVGEHGAHDHDTIMINTTDVEGNKRLSEFEAAMVLVHEYEHATRARDGGTEYDPATSDPLCGPCEHSMMYSEQIARVAVAFCSEDPEDQEEPCLFVSLALDAEARAFAGCDQNHCLSGHRVADLARSNAFQIALQCCN